LRRLRHSRRIRDYPIVRGVSRIPAADSRSRGSTYGSDALVAEFLYILIRERAGLHCLTLLPILAGEFAQAPVANACSGLPRHGRRHTAFEIRRWRARAGGAS
jgi:hypothetical protein